MIGFGQQTYVPDNNFEAYLEANGMGNGVPNDDYVTTANINSVTGLYTAFQSISDLIGIEDFTDLTTLYCNGNNISSIDVSNNTNLTDLRCSYNALTTLNVSNGNNVNMILLANGNNNLLCIEVDDVSWSTSNWTLAGTNIDAWMSFSTDCSAEFFGCTDPLSCNYDSLATIDNASCIYPVIWQQVFSICYGGSVIVGNSIYDTTGSYIDTLTTLNGCDSIVYTNISIVPPSVWQWGTAICYGDSVMVGTSVYDTTGNYIDTLTTVIGCDSIVYTNISIDYNTSSYDTLSFAESIVWNGIPLNVSGDYDVTFMDGNANGCDSIAYLNLTITTTGIFDIANNKSNLVKITNMLGKETPYRRNTPLFYIYDDGTVEKRIVIE